MRLSSIYFANRVCSFVIDKKREKLLLLLQLALIFLFLFDALRVKRFLSFYYYFH
jgi:hypothetical protein